MPEKETIERAREDAQEGKSPTTQAGEFVREEIDHIRRASMGWYQSALMQRVDCCVAPTVD